MKNFTYYQPASVKDAVGLLGDKWGPVELLAGGTDLLDLQKEYIAQPDKVVSLTGIKGFSEIGGYTKKDPPAESGFTLGAGMKLSDIAENAYLKKLYPALTTAAGMDGGPQIRNMGTLGGSLCQRNRCWYFRDEHVHCLLKGGDKCYALDGENQYHAIFSQGHKCVIVNPSTLAPALIALGASAQVLGPKGERTVSLAKFFQAPTSATEREHVLAPNEIVTLVSIPDKGLKNASYEVRHKQSYDWPLAQAAVAFKLEGGKVKDARIVLGHVAPTPVIATEAAKALEGKEVTDDVATAVGKEAVKDAKPLSQNGYKVRLAQVAVKRAILIAAGKPKYWEL
jgi:xanthine dehydrogenase YagS FAD-binding subunit